MLQAPEEPVIAEHARSRCCRAASRRSRSARNSRASTPTCSTSCSTTPAKSASSARALEQQIGSIEFNLAELGAHGHAPARSSCASSSSRPKRRSCIATRTRPGTRGDFDPLELDRYSSIQQFSRALAETASDVGSIEGLLENLTTRRAEPAAAAGAHRHRTAERPDAHAHGAVPAPRAAPRAHRAPGRHRHAARRPSCASRAPRASSIARCSSACCRRSSTCCATPSCTASRRPRSARRAASPRAARSPSRCSAKAPKSSSSVADDGAGMNVKRDPRQGASQLGLLRAEQHAHRRRSAAADPRARASPPRARLTQQAGRGVGMDVVANEIKKLGGALHIESQPGPGRALHDPPAVHARDQPGADRARRTTSCTRCRCPPSKASCACRAPRSQRHLGRGSAAVRIRRAEVPLPAPGRSSSAREPSVRCRMAT